MPRGNLPGKEIKMYLIKNIPFVFHKHTYEPEASFITIGLQGGMTTREIVVNQRDTIVCNRAFFHVWSRYLCQSRQELQITCDVMPTSTILSCMSDRETCYAVISDLLKAVFQMDYQEAMFLEMKKQAENAFEDRYKCAEFRARYKAMEITDMSKRFRLREFIDELLELDFVTFCRMAEHFLTPGNIVVYVNGSYGDMTKAVREMLEGQIPDTMHELQLLYWNTDPYLRQDAHLAELAGENLNRTVLYVDFLGRGTLLSRFIWLALAAQNIHCQNVEINIDGGDSSIIFAPLTMKEEKSIFAEPLSKGAFQYAQKKLLRGYAELLGNQPAMWGEAVAAYLLMGIDMVELLEMIDKCSYDLFLEIEENVKPKITEIQIVFRKERRKWQRYT